jgi:hypothetical protein
MILDKVSTFMEQDLLFLLRGFCVDKPFKFHYLLLQKLNAKNSGILVKTRPGKRR